MDNFACNVIATFGGATAISRFTSAPVSTVHSWKHNGIPQSRIAHLQLIAEKEAIAIDWETGLAAKASAPESEPSPHDGAEALSVSATNSEEIIRSADRHQEGGHGGPFLPFSATSSATSAPPQLSPGSQVSSRVGEADAA